MGKYRTLFTDENGWIERTKIERLTDPTGLRPGEHDFGDFFPNSNNPVRLGAYATPPEGYDWLDCKVVGLDIVPLTDEEKAARDAAKIEAENAAITARQAAKPAKLKQAENNFILVCDAARQAIGQPTTQAKLSTAELQALIEAIKVVDFNAATELSLKALSTIHEVEVHGGSWDDLIWHEVI